MMRPPARMAVAWRLRAAAFAAAPLIARASPEAIAEAGGTSAPSPFPAPESLQPAISFWTDIFTRYDSDHVLLHDRDRVEITWQVIELPRDDDGAVDESKAQPAVHKALDELRKRLQRLESDPTPA